MTSWKPRIVGNRICHEVAPVGDPCLNTTPDLVCDCGYIRCAMTGPCAPKPPPVSNNKIMLRDLLIRAGWERVSSPTLSEKWTTGYFTHRLVLEYRYVHSEFEYRVRNGLVTLAQENTFGAITHRCLELMVDVAPV